MGRAHSALDDRRTGAAGYPVAREGGFEATVYDGVGNGAAGGGGGGGGCDGGGGDGGGGDGNGGEGAKKVEKREEKNN